ncbi:MAG: tRNA (adenosine(37)-N6)-threonylcarbamoyltransferase complex transferase subunit TsaD [Verrucomicrobiae bacterium]|nr:tRNA (adenosine(37)-N6)-threonylcarbamoyltransferase complex transferase subunit TsaD [Verrucomicrobiae bacterium]
MVLAIETSCDETSAAVVQDGGVRSSVVASQIRLHAEYGGVVPELATREHLKHLLPVCRAALAEAGASLGEVTAVAATRGPGLPAALRAGFTTAEALAFALEVPLFGIHHHEAHLYSPWIAGRPPVAEWDRLEPNVSLIVSGGHTLLVAVRGELEHQVLGGTLDDAAGECFDKVAKLLGLPYPGGPEVDRLAAEGDARRFEFPRPLLGEPNDDFSFSGLKTSVRYFLEKNPDLPGDPQSLRDLCAGVQSAIVEVLAAKTLAAARRLGYRCVTASGGVSCNSGLRHVLAAGCDRHRITLRVALPALCTDNAAMVGILAERMQQRGVPATPLDVEPIPGWELASGKTR